MHKPKLTKFKIPVFHQISGRLGNQLFEWAFAVKANQQHNRPIYFFKDKFHEVAGYEDNLDAGFIYSSSNFKLLNLNLVGQTLRIFDKYKYRHPKCVQYFERLLGFYRSKDAYGHVEELPDKTLFVTGFFINFETFAEIEDKIYEELVAVLSCLELPSEISNQLPAEYQVLHARRGDFLIDEARYGILDTEYYKQYLDPNLPIILCSDEPNNCGDLIKELNVDIILGPKEINAWQTIKILANSKKVVMSNSTLSWWGAFLCVENGGTAVIPSPFYASSSIQDSALRHPGFTEGKSIFR
jgi:hypothetical protein